MKKLKYITAFFIFSLLIFPLTGCAKPETSVEAELNAIRDLDGDAIARYLSSEDIFEGASGDMFSTDTKEVFNIILKEFDYEIIAVDKDRTTASVTVSLTMLDMEPVVRDFKSLLLQHSVLSNIDSAYDLDTSDMFSLLKELLNSDSNTITEELVIQLEKVKGEWIIVADEAFISALTGHFAAIANDEYLLSPEETAEIILDTIIAMTTEQLHDYIIPVNFLSEDGSLEEILLKKIDTSLSYKILNTESKDRSSKVTIELTNIYLAALLPRYEELLNESISSYGGVMPSDDQIANSAQTSLTQALEELDKTHIFTLDVNLINNGNYWMLDSNETLADALRGGLSDFEKKLVEMNN